MIKESYFAGGCFWCIAAVFTDINGVIEVISGFSGETEDNQLPPPSYEDVKSQKTPYRETIKIIYDDTLISYEKILSIFLENVDPFDEGGQYIDRGFSYTLAIFYKDEIELLNAKQKIDELEKISNKKVYISLEKYSIFYIADEFHQNYHQMLH